MSSLLTLVYAQIAPLAPCKTSKTISPSTSYIVQLCKILPIAATDGEQLVRKALYDAEISIPATSSLLPSSLSRERLVHSVSKTSKLKKQSALTTKNTSKSSIKTIICPICEEAVVDPSSKNDGHDSIFCEGACKAWLHRGCAGMSKTVFEKVCDTDDPLFCPSVDRWKLIQSGISRKEIKIRNDRLFVHNKLYSKIFDSVFHLSSSDHVTISSQSKSSAVIIPDPLNNSTTDSTPATDPTNGLANLSHSGSD